jgi:hypothetical protein
MVLSKQGCLITTIMAVNMSMAAVESYFLGGGRGAVVILSLQHQQHDIIIGISLNVTIVISIIIVFTVIIIGRC